MFVVDAVLCCWAGGGEMIASGCLDAAAAEAAAAEVAAAEAAAAEAEAEAAAEVVVVVACLGCLA